MRTPHVICFKLCLEQYVCALCFFLFCFFAFKHLALLWNLSKYFIIILQGYFVKCGLNVRREFLVLWERGFWNLPIYPTQFCLHTYCTLTSAGASAYFITTFVQKILALNQMSNHVKFFAPLCHFFMSRKVPRHFRAISWRWLSFLCIDKKAQIFTLPLSYPPAKCCHLSMCARHIFLDSLAWTLLVELKWV